MDRMQWIFAALAAAMLLPVFGYMIYIGVATTNTPPIIIAQLGPSAEGVCYNITISRPRTLIPKTNLVKAQEAPCTLKAGYDAKTAGRESDASKD